MSHPATQWRLLRIKADETTDDPDYVATNDPEAGSIDFTDVDAVFPDGTSADGRPFTGIEVIVFGVDAAGAVMDRGSMTVDMQLLEYIPRSNPQLNGNRAATLEPVLAETEIEEDVPLHAKVYWPFNGGQFAIRLSNDANDGVDNLEVMWRAVSR
jgi:hypothetical protein